MPNTQVLKFDPSGKKFIISKSYLVISQPKGEPRRLDLPASVTLIGSNPECDIVIRDKYVSGRHCRIAPGDGGFLLEDLNSTNGTYIGETKIHHTALKPKTSFVIGKTKIFFDSTVASEPVVPMEQNHFCGLVGQAESMRALYTKISRVAATDQTVLISGETGSGKELVAWAVHELSPRKERPYVILNCGAISSNLIESELFGHEKGAFTGAHSRRAGAFEQANGGALFLDEVGELPLELQPKLLRVLENRTIRRVGGDAEIPVDVRVIAATHRNLSEQARKGLFREDLFFRLFVIPLSVPPLRERPEDIPLLAEYFIHQASPKSPLAFSRKALEKLAEYAWPGNIRELKNVILRSLVFCDGPEISATHIELMGEEVKTGDQMDLDRVEKEKILEALDKTGDNKTKAADLLGIAKSTLFKKIKDYGIAE
ncbi:MAG: sigma 54-interacting transcriptional regulator [Deltaproteobacteria bacterium]|nr:sigma 54-interacting transcriptional regulator [Deltaproteobacteria bacterium]